MDVNKNRKISRKVAKALQVFVPTKGLNERSQAIYCLEQFK